MRVRASAGRSIEHRVGRAREVVGSGVEVDERQHGQRPCDGAIALRLRNADEVAHHVQRQRPREVGHQVERASLDRTVDNYPRYANCGPILWPNNLRTAVLDGRVRPGTLVLGYSIGSVSTASAVVFRAGEISVAERSIG